jgi:hypothetical protein
MKASWPRVRNNAEGMGWEVGKGRLTRTGQFLLLERHVLTGRLGWDGIHSDALFERLDHLS